MPRLTTDAKLWLIAAALGIAGVVLSAALRWSGTFDLTVAATSLGLLFYYWRKPVDETRFEYRMACLFKLPPIIATIYGTAVMVLGIIGRDPFMLVAPVIAFVRAFAASFLIGLGWICVFRAPRHKRRQGFYCPKCDYRVDNIPGPRCPECGYGDVSS